MDANNILQNVKFYNLFFNEEDKTTRLNRIEKYIPEEFDKQLNKYFMFLWMQPSFKYHESLICSIPDDQVFLKITKIHNGLDCTLINADQTEGKRIVCFRLLSLNPHDCESNLCVSWKKYKNTCVLKEKCDNFVCEGIASDELGDLIFYNKNHEKENYEIKSKFF